MKFQIDISISGQPTHTTQIVEADSRAEIEEKIATENPDVNFNANEMFDSLIGKKYRADGTGTEKIIIVQKL